MEEKIDITTIGQKIDFYSIVRDILRQWWLILIMSLSVSMIADIVVNEMYTPTYSAQATCLVTARGVNSNVYTNLSTTSELAERLTYVLESNVLKQKVEEDLGYSYEADVSVSQLSETNIITISVSSDSAMTTYRVIVSFLENYASVSEYVVENAIVEVLQSPSIPSGPSNSMNERNTVRRVFLITVAVFILLVAISSYLRDTVKNEHEFTEKVDAKLLGVIPHERKHSRSKWGRRTESMLITNQMRSFGFVESCKMSASRIRSQMDSMDAKVLLLTSVMENEGKSTIAANLALALAQEHKNVVLIDCDFRKPSQYKIFRVPEDRQRDLRETLQQGTNLDRIIGMEKDSGLYTVFNNTAFDGLTTPEEISVFRAIVRFFRKKMDYVILDTSPMMLVSHTEELAQMCDATVLVVRRDTILTRDINDSIDALNNTKSKVAGCVFNDAAKGIGASSGAYGYGSRYGYGGHYGKRD